MQLDFNSLGEVLSQIGPDYNASEWHGILSGLICIKASDAQVLWRDHIIAELGENKDPAPEEQINTLLLPAYQETLRQLTSPDCDFQPVLPDDSASIAERTRALAQWAQGLLVGMSYGGLQDLKDLPVDSKEILMDMTKIAKAGGYAVEGTEEDENAFTEIAEYLRAAVLLVFQELNPTESTHPADKTRLH
jgi:uncharacterized protein YgfB (UPF0149 family)